MTRIPRWPSRSAGPAPAVLPGRHRSPEPCLDAAAHPPVATPTGPARPVIRLSTTLTSYVSLAAAMLIVGTSIVASKIVVDTCRSTPLGLRFLIAAIVLVIVAGRGGGIPSLPPRGPPALAGQALAGHRDVQCLLLLGLDRTTAIASGIITSMTPAVVALLSIPLVDRLRPAGWLGVALAVAGVVVVKRLRHRRGGKRVEATARRGAGFHRGCRRGALRGARQGRDRGGEASADGDADDDLRVRVLPAIRGHRRRRPPSRRRAGEGLAGDRLSRVGRDRGGASWFRVADVPASTAGAFTGMMTVGTILATAIFLDEPVRAVTSRASRW